MAFVNRPRGTYAKTAGRRVEIIDATVAVFAESGFHGGTIRDIAERVGISQAGLLHHFASKEALLEAVLTHRDELARDRLGPEMPTGLALLQGFVELITFNATTPGLVALYVVLSGEGTAPEHPGHQYFHDRYVWVRELLENAVRQGQQRGELRGDADPEAVARTIIALSDGLQVQWLYEDGALDMATPVKAYIQTLLPD
jgi:AcrR family transcriptional regulator